MRTSLFQRWLQEMYMRHKYESLEYKITCKDAKQYFNDNKWWLKNQFKLWMKKHKIQSK